MKIAILSDIHDNIWTLHSALAAIQAADVMICCGDLCSPFIIPLMADAFRKPIHMVYGNNDGDLYRMTNNAQRFDHFHIEGEFYECVMDGKNIAVNHFDNIGRELARSDLYDIVCFGHNHCYQIERIEKTLAINPGTLMGYDPINKKDVPPTFVILDTAADRTSSFQVLVDSACQGILPIKLFDE